MNTYIKLAIIVFAILLASMYVAYAYTTLVVSIDTSNYVSSSALNSSTFTRIAQSFIPTNTVTVTSSSFYLEKIGSPTGNIVSKIYAHTGTYGSTGVPSGSALATSDAVDVSTLTGSNQVISFTYSGANRISLTGGTPYFVSVEYTGGDSSDSPKVGFGSTAPFGNNAIYSIFWSHGTNGVIFYLYGDNGKQLSPMLLGMGW